jgi:hypothetical protein
MAFDPKFRNFAIVATYVSAGVKAGGPGIVIVNGKVIKVPPRGPANQLLQQALKAVMATAKKQIA